jgi:hypothetical protein
VARNDRDQVDRVAGASGGWRAPLLQLLAITWFIGVSVYYYDHKGFVQLLGQLVGGGAW